MRGTDSETKQELPWPASVQKYSDVVPLCLAGWKENTQQLQMEWLTEKFVFTKTRNAAIHMCLQKFVIVVNFMYISSIQLHIARWDIVVAEKR